MKKKMLLFTFCTLILGIVFINLNVSADSKKHLAQIVMEHESKIAILEDFIKNQESDPNSTELLTADVKQALLKEVEIKYPDFTRVSNYEGQMLHLNVKNFEIIQKDGQIVLQFFLEGDYDWSQKVINQEVEGEEPYTYTQFGEGRQFAQNFIFNFDPIPKMYGVNLTYEFYQNGERIRLFTDND
jgi:hypothetical protein